MRTGQLILHEVEFSSFSSFVFSSSGEGGGFADVAREMEIGTTSSSLSVSSRSKKFSRTGCSGAVYGRESVEAVFARVGGRELLLISRAKLD